MSRKVLSFNQRNLLNPFKSVVKTYFVIVSADLQYYKLWTKALKQAECWRIECFLKDLNNELTDNKTSTKYRNLRYPLCEKKIPLARTCCLGWFRFKGWV